MEGISQYKRVVYWRQKINGRNISGQKIEWHEKFAI